MRRDYFTLAVHGIDWVDSGESPEQPTVRIDFEGPATLLHERLTGLTAAPLEASDIDVSFRFVTPIDDDVPRGVFAITDRITGDYVLEVNTDIARIDDFVRAAKAFGEATDDEDRYRIVIDIEGDKIVVYEKRTFLLYNQQGNLLREESLIPSGVEL